MSDRFAPILPSRSFDTTAAFYERAGFEVVRRTEPPDYAWMILARDHLWLHFYAFEHDPATSDRMVYLHLTDPDEWADRLRKLDLPADGIASFRDIQDRDWEMREFALIDPDGTLIRAGRSS